MLAPYQKTLHHGRFETWTTKPEMSFHHVKQIHGVSIATVDQLPCDADGIVMSWEDFDLPLAIKTADCMPIVIEGKKGVVFLHAGWRGLADGILKQSEIKNIQPESFFIGPAIHECCFEVSEDFRENFPTSTHFSSRDGKIYFNLVAEAQDQLKFFFPQVQPEISSVCTSCDSNFHSYRKTKTILRNWNLYIKG